MRRSILRARTREIGEVVEAGEPTVVVSSGAIALGLPHLAPDRRPHAVPMLQAASALGQTRLQIAWERALGREGVRAAQVLLTAADVADRTAYVNARNALHTLLANGVVPIVNENDATATDEITFGDNDALAAHVAILVRARLLVLPRRSMASSRARREPRGQSSSTRDPRLGTRSSERRRSSAVAACVARWSRRRWLLLPGSRRSSPGRRSVLGPILDGEPRGTRFHEDGRELSGYKVWLRFSESLWRDAFIADAGAPRRHRAGTGACSPSGWSRARALRRGDAVESAPGGEVFAKGIVGAPAAEIAARPRDVEAIHRDRLVLY